MRTVVLSAVALLLIMLKASQATPASAQPGFSPVRGNYRAADEERAKAASRYSDQPTAMQPPPSVSSPVRPASNSTRLAKAKKAKRCSVVVDAAVGAADAVETRERRRERPDYSTIRRGKRSIPEQKPEEECECDKEEQNEKPANEEACDCEDKDTKDEKCADEKEEKCEMEKEEKCEEKEETEKETEKEESCGCDKNEDDEEETTDAPSTTIAPIDESKILFRFRKVAPSPTAYKVTTPGTEDDDEEEEQEEEGEVTEETTEAASEDDNDEDEVTSSAPVESTTTMPSDEDVTIKYRKAE
ncbi:hypothetical protein PRIPAC_73459 [Pristionchus pacificus]|uniref:Uncharacterized protein n=1 Tax=Pristionchus pacificus TaxID=54126 RepID=A0A2A6CFR8_PRIPA|nr:hypothetical protein PRIPAC_73459 [Pristionchus pacificus]|eukprot:PDM77054.1 hypothetical protein PRIPAC_42449 [Pristionchus pacificus]